MANLPSESAHHHPPFEVHFSFLLFEKRNRKRGPAEIKFSRRWSVSVAPGISFGDSGLMYAKLAYISGKPGSVAFEGQTHSGYGYGVGARFMLNQNVYVNVEVMQNDYETKTYNDLGLDVSAENTTGMFSLGYSF